MDEHSLRAILSRCPSLKHVKVLAKNEFKNQLGLYIVNNQPKGCRGQHWLAVSVSETSAEFFDSFGLPPSHYGFSDNYSYSLKCLQSKTSFLCWAYCIYYLKKHVNGVDLDTIVSMLSDDVHDNESFVLKSVVDML